MAGVGAVSFDLFGTLVAAERPDDPAAEIAAALAERGVAVPDDWDAAFRERHLERPAGAEQPLAEHVAAALASRSESGDRDPPAEEVERAVRDAFDSTIRTRDGAATAVERVGASVPVGVLSNCSVRRLAGRALARSAVDERALDAVVTSVDCGWRKPDPRAFRAVARGLGVDTERLLHVGDDPVADGGATDAGARALLTDEVSIPDVPAVVEERWG